MFTGIIEEIGQIQAVKHGAASSRLTIQAAKILSDVHDGDSIAVNGVCLTVTSHGSGYFTADVMHESLRRSALGNLSQGSRVNLDRAMAANEKLLRPAEAPTKPATNDTSITMDFLEKYGF